MATDGSHNAAALLASPVRRRLVDALANADGGATTPGLTAAELGSQVGLHVTTVRFHLDQLVAAGLVESAVRREGGAGRPGSGWFTSGMLLPGTCLACVMTAWAIRLRLSSLVARLAASRIAWTANGRAAMTRKLRQPMTMPAVARPEPLIRPTLRPISRLARMPKTSVNPIANSA